jgi:hypothetical protein
VDTLVVLLVAVALTAAIVFIGAPLRRRAGDRAETRDEPSRAALEAAKESKYREIRDAELDYRTGKLSEEDFQALDATLRAEAVEILAKLDALDGE